MPDTKKTVPSPATRPKTILRSRLREEKEADKTRLEEEAEAAKNDPTELSNFMHEMFYGVPAPSFQHRDTKPPVSSDDKRELVYIDTRPPLRTPTFSGGSSGTSKPNRRRRR